MLISEVIEKIKRYCRGYGIIDESKTRDKILFGSTDKECTGIVVTCWASSDVIREAARLGANLIVCHEALFWNHGDHTDWLEEQENPVYLAKKKLLEKNGITVWRDHDYIHSGIPVNGIWTDGIFYGLAHQLGWTEHFETDASDPMSFVFDDPKTVREIADHLMGKLHLNGIKLIGDPAQPVRKVKIMMHLFGPDNDAITDVTQSNTDLMIAMEMVDFSLMEYVRDSGQLGYNKAILCPGHFNTEEPGMEYCLEYFPKILGPDLPVWFVPSSDNYKYLLR